MATADRRPASSKTRKRGRQDLLRSQVDQSQITLSRPGNAKFSLVTMIVNWISHDSATALGYDGDWLRVGAATDAFLRLG